MKALLCCVAPPSGSLIYIYNRLQATVSQHIYGFMTNKVYQGCTHLFPIVFVQCTKNRSIVKLYLIPNWFKVYVKLEILQIVNILDWSQKLHY